MLKRIRSSTTRTWITMVGGTHCDTCSFVIADLRCRMLYCLDRVSERSRCVVRTAICCVVTCDRKSVACGVARVGPTEARADAAVQLREGGAHC